jgi:hypothetical protein
MNTTLKAARVLLKMKNTLKTIYLCGPMDQVPKKYSLDWRKKATSELSKKGITVEDPTDRVNLPNDVIVEGDKKAIKNSQCVLAYVPKGVPFVGTSMEIFYASQVLGIPVVAWGEGNGTNPSPWIDVHSTYVCETLDEALSVIFEAKR